jgi:hypothetical protein
MNTWNSFGMAAISCALCSIAPIANAQSSVIGDASSLEFTVTTAIAPRCGWAPSGAPAASISLGSLDVAGSKDVPFQVDCNTPFTFTASSANQTFLRENPMANLPQTFTQSIDYSINVAIGVRQKDGSATTAADTCGANELQGASSCGFGALSSTKNDFIGDAVATSADTSLPRSRLRVIWSGPTPGAPTPVAGTYSDVLTVSVEAKS